VPVLHAVLVVNSVSSAATEQTHQIIQDMHLEGLTRADCLAQDRMFNVNMQCYGVSRAGMIAGEAA
jgi:hypothetical protein